MSWEGRWLLSASLTNSAPLRIALAKLTAGGGEIDREKERLEVLVERQRKVAAETPEVARRFGEDDIPEVLVARRRQREHRRRVHAAAKRVEDQRTVLAGLRSQERALRAQLHQAQVEVNAQLPLTGADRRAEAAAYLDGALRTHRQRSALVGALGELAPEPHVASVSGWGES